MFFYFLCVFSAYSLAAATGRGEAAVRSAKQKLDFPKYLEIIITKILNVKTILFHRVRPPDDPVEVLSKDDEIITKYIIENYEENYEKRETRTTLHDEEECMIRKEINATENERNTLLSSIKFQPLNPRQFKLFNIEYSKVISSENYNGDKKSKLITENNITITNTSRKLDTISKVYENITKNFNTLVIKQMRQIQSYAPAVSYSAKLDNDSLLSNRK